MLRPLSLLLLIITIAHGARILGIFIHPGPSHFYSFYPVMNALAEKGHDVTSWSYFKVKNPHRNYHEIILEGTPIINSSMSLDVLDHPSRSLYTVYREFFALAHWADITCRDAINSPQLDQILEIHNQKSFDIVLVELFDTDCPLGIIHKLNVPHIGMSSCALFPWYYDRVNLPDVPSYNPSGFLDHANNMNVVQRAKNWLIFKTMKLLFRFITQNNDNKLLREKFPDLPDVANIANNISLVLINQHYSMSGPKPLSNQVIEIGGVHIKSAKPLPKNLRVLIENAKDGVIFISWGGNIKASSLPNNKVRAILRALARFPQQIIWKWEDDTINDIKSDNVHIFNWLPQRDILEHPNVKVFWSHGGNLGTNEAVYCGTPTIITPIYGDQFINAEALVERGTSFHLPYDKINEENVYNAIQHALSSKVRENAKAVAYEYKNRPLSPIETAVWWVEHTIATSGAQLLQLKTYEMSWIVYYSLDAVAITASVFILPTGVIYLILCYFNRRRKINGKEKLKNN